jgi:arylsulfatase
LHEDNRALRVGDWKLVAAGADGPWELYDLASDRGESNDLAKQRPEKVQELAAEWTRRWTEIQDLAKRESVRPIPE